MEVGANQVSKAEWLQSARVPRLERGDVGGRGLGREGPELDRCS